VDKFDRMQQLHRLFSARRTPIRISELAEKLECSEKTVYRAIQNLRDYVQAPLLDSPDRQGWYYDLKGEEKFELPGLWLTAGEINGLAIIIELAREMESGLLSEDIGLVTKAVEKLLETRKVQPDIFRQKVAYLPKRKHSASNRNFQHISSALINEKQLSIDYSDYQGRRTKRVISPLKLVHYDENWYLDAWCHMRKSLRSFLVARIVRIETLSLNAIEVPDSNQQEHFSSSYGIFAGRAKHQAKIKFTGAASREVASFQWHPKQQAEWQGTAYLLEIPYNDDRELIRTILGYGANAEVLAPSELKQKILRKAKDIVSTYDSSWGSGKF
jgi:proteasome accessory factor C